MSKQKRRKLEKPLADLQAEGEYEDEISSTNPNSPISDQWQEQVQCHAVERVLKAFRDPFIKSIDASAVIQELQHADTISDGDVEEIKQIKDATQQSARLHKMLEDKCTADAFMEFCDMVSSVKGNRRMKGLGKNMKKQLESLLQGDSQTSDMVNGKKPRSRNSSYGSDTSHENTISPMPSTVGQSSPWLPEKKEFVFQPKENSGTSSISIKLPPLPVTMNVISSVIFENKIYISGTKEEDVPKSCQIHVYSLKDLEWSTLPEAPICNAAIVVVNDQITLLGGRDAENHKPTNIVWSWFEKEGEWRHSILSPMPSARMAIAVCHYDNILLAVGGGEENGTDCTAVNRVDVYNFTSQQWSTLPELQLPEARRSHFLVCLEGYIYLTGGSPNFCEDSEFSSNSWSVKCTDVAKAVQFPAAKSEECLWKRAADLPVLRSTVVSCESSIFSVGGVKDHKPQDAIYRFVREQDGNHMHWIKVGKLNIGKYRHAVVPLGSCTLFVAGGYEWGKFDGRERKSASVEVVPL